MVKIKNYSAKLLAQTILGILAFSLLVSVGAIWVYFDTFSGNISTDQSVWGAFGDYFGGTLNTVFSFLALLAILLTLFLQRNQLEVSARELELSRTELALTKVEVARSADALHQQSLNLKTQRFENTLFNLLDLLAKIKSEIVIERPQKTLNGKQALEVIYSDFKNKFVDNTSRSYENPTVTFKSEYKSLDSTKKYYSALYNKELSKYLVEYFRLTCQLLKFVDDSVDIQNKHFYTNILRAQLSKHEHCLIMYHAVSNSSNEDLLPLIKKYKLLEYLDINEIWEEHRYLVEICNQ